MGWDTAGGQQRVGAGVGWGRLVASRGLALLVGEGGGPAAAAEQPSGYGGEGQVEGHRCWLIRHTAPWNPRLWVRPPSPLTPLAPSLRSICNRDIIARVQQVICFAFHDSSLLLETCQEARAETKIVTLFYLD